MKGIITMITVVVLQLLYVASYAQKHAALGIGDTLSSIPLSNVAGGAEGRLLFNAPDSKAVILDFGTTGCAPCLTSLLHLDSLQKQFDGALAVFFVTREKQQYVERFIKHNVVGAKVGGTIPVIYADTLLHNVLFPHIYQPHQVWIDRLGVVRAITDHHAANTTTLDQLVRGMDMVLPQKLDYLYDVRSPIVQLNRSFIGNRSGMGIGDDFVVAILGEQNGYVSKRYQQTDSATQSIRETYINYPILKLYLSLLGRRWKTSFYPAQVDIKGVPSGFYTDNVTLEVCYDRHRRRKEVDRRIKGYLDAYFDIEVDLLKKPRKVWTVRPIRGAEHRAEGSVSAYNFVYRMNQRIASVYMYDETDRDIKVAFDDACLAMTIDELNGYLRKYGVRVDEEEKVIEVLCIKGKESAP